MACIIVELYTGEMFFATHENVEHLAMMEKACGPFPYWMAKHEYKHCFDTSRSPEEVKRKGMLMKWPEVAKK